MRNFDAIFENRTCLVGTICAAETAYGAPIDTRGFGAVMGMLSAGALGGTGGNTGTLSVKWQECARVLGSTTEWSDITDNGVAGGSFDFDALTVQALTTFLAQGKCYAKLAVGGGKRFIRCHASLAGTDSVNCAYSVSVLLGAANDTLYINGGSTVSTGNSEFSLISLVT